MKIIFIIILTLIIAILLFGCSNNYTPPIEKTIREPYQSNRAAFPTDSYCGELGSGLPVGYVRDFNGNTMPNEYCLFNCREGVIWNTGECRILPDGECPSEKMFNQRDITCK